MAPHDAARDGKPEPAAAGVAAARRLESHEGLEHPLHVGLRDPRPLVLDDNADFPIVPLDPHQCPAPVGGRVLQHVAQRPALRRRPAAARPGLCPRPRCRGPAPRGRPPRCRPAHGGPPSAPPRARSCAAAGSPGCRPPGRRARCPGPGSPRRCRATRRNGRQRSTPRTCSTSTRRYRRRAHRGTFAPPTACLAQLLVPRATAEARGSAFPLRLLVRNHDRPCRPSRRDPGRSVRSQPHARLRRQQVHAEAPMQFPGQCFVWGL